MQAMIFVSRDIVEVVYRTADGKYAIQVFASMPTHRALALLPQYRIAVADVVALTHTVQHFRICNSPNDELYLQRLADLPDDPDEPLTTHQRALWYDNPDDWPPTAPDE